MRFLAGWWEIGAVMGLGVLTYATGSWLPLIPLFALWLVATARARRT